MSSLKSIAPKTDHDLAAPPRKRVTEGPRENPHEDPRQRGLMLGALCLLLLALGIVLWHDRDFWFPDAQEAESELPVESAPSAKAPPVQEPAIATPVSVAKLKPRVPLKTKEVASAIDPPAAEIPVPPVVATSRTVLPPLEVEVVAGDSHRTIRPGSSSVRVDLQPGTPPQPAIEAAPSGDAQTAANVTSNAAERVQMSTDASEIVTAPVRPNYPLLARQMKVQGSVILQALIGRDGIIQNLRLVSGPRILASAAEDAVRQWHFKPHYQGSEAVETQAKITVNFTISTN
ncbi:MAG: TonB family protein [Candidatus Sulfotelmatobacter sp.]